MSNPPWYPGYGGAYPPPDGRQYHARGRPYNPPPPPPPPTGPTGGYPNPFSLPPTYSPPLPNLPPPPVGEHYNRVNPREPSGNNPPEHLSNLRSSIACRMDAEEKRERRRAHGEEDDDEDDYHDDEPPIREPRVRMRRRHRETSEYEEATGESSRRRARDPSDYEEPPSPPRRRRAETPPSFDYGEEDEEDGEMYFKISEPSRGKTPRRPAKPSSSASRPEPHRQGGSYRSSEPEKGKTRRQPSTSRAGPSRRRDPTPFGDDRRSYGLQEPERDLPRQPSASRPGPSRRRRSSVSYGDDARSYGMPGPSRQPPGESSRHRETTTQDEHRRRYPPSSSGFPRRYEKGKHPAHEQPAVPPSPRHPQPGLAPYIPSFTQAPPSAQQQQQQPPGVTPCIEMEVPTLYDERTGTSEKLGQRLLAVLGATFSPQSFCLMLWNRRQQQHQPSHSLATNNPQQKADECAVIRDLWYFLTRLAAEKGRLNALAALLDGGGGGNAARDAYEETRELKHEILAWLGGLADQIPGFLGWDAALRNEREALQQEKRDLQDELVEISTSTSTSSSRSRRDKAYKLRACNENLEHVDLALDRVKRRQAEECETRFEDAYAEVFFRPENLMAAAREKIARLRSWVAVFEAEGWEEELRRQGLVFRPRMMSQAEFTAQGGNMLMYGGGGGGW